MNETTNEFEVILFETDTFLAQYRNHKVACRHCREFGFNRQHEALTIEDVRMRGNIKEKELRLGY